MGVYRLDPIPTALADPRWQVSAVTETIFVDAASPSEARALASAATNPSMPQLGHRSPWLEERLTLCVLEPRGPDVPQGNVITADGEPVRNA